MGRPMPGWDVQILDQDEQPVPQGERGEICLRARSNPHYPLGYWSNEEAARETFGGDWFHTKDAAKFDEDGYVWYEGRADDVIIAAGYRIGPFEVESACLEHAASRRRRRSPRPTSGVAASSRRSSCSPRATRARTSWWREIQEHVRSRLSAYAYPRRIEFVDDLPKTLTGKIRRIELRQRVEAEGAGSGRARARCCRSGGAPGRARRAGRAGRAAVAAAGRRARLRPGAAVGARRRCRRGRGVLAAERASAERLRVLALPAVTCVALFAGYLARRARAWTCSSRGTGTSCCPGSAAGCRRSAPCGCRTSSADPWPRIVLELLGAELLILAGLLTFWPRAAHRAGRARAADGARARLPVRGARGAAGRDRLAGRLARRTRSLLLGLALAALTVVLPVAGAAAAEARARRRRAARGRAARARCPSRPPPTAASRGSTTAPSPRASGPTTRCASRGRRATGRSPGRATATRSCGSSPASRCTGRRATWTCSTAIAWTTRWRPSTPTGEEPCEADLPQTGATGPAWTSTIEVCIRRMRIRDVIGAGTTVDVSDASRTVEPAISPGTWDAAGPAAPRRLLHAPTCTSRARRSCSWPMRPRAASTSARRASASSRCRSSPSRSTRSAAAPPASSPAPSRPDHRGRGALQGLGRRRIRPRRLSRPSSARTSTSTGSWSARSTSAPGRSPNSSRRAPSGRWTTSGPSTTTCTGPSSATSSGPRRRPPASRRWTTSSTRRTRATASTTRARWRCCCGWAASRRASRPASRPAGSRRARRPGSCATPTLTRGSRCGSTSTAGFRSTRRRTARPRARRSPRWRPRPARHRRRPRPTPAPPTPRPTPSGRISRYAPSSSSARATTRFRAPRPAAASACGSGRCSRSPSPWSCSACFCSCGGRVAARRWTARSTRSRTRSNASGVP